MRIFLLFLVGGAGTAVIGNQTGNAMALLVGVALVVLTLFLGWRYRPHHIVNGRWTCRAGHSCPAGMRRCTTCRAMGQSGRH